MSRRVKRTITTIISLAVLLIAMLAATPEVAVPLAPNTSTVAAEGDAATVLETLPVKGRAPKTGYARAQFGNGWGDYQGCDMRNVILFRDLTNTTVDDQCRVLTGQLADPYTNTIISFQRSESEKVQIDHVIALSDAWQKGAQQLSKELRVQLANDPLELLAVYGSSNQQKGDSDAATWLPVNKLFRCTYVARQIAVKQKYALWVTQPEKDAMLKVLSDCRGQSLPAK